MDTYCLIGNVTRHLVHAGVITLGREGLNRGEFRRCPGVAPRRVGKASARHAFQVRVARALHPLRNTRGPRAVRARAFKRSMKSGDSARASPSSLLTAVASVEPMSRKRSLPYRTRDPSAAAAKPTRLMTLSRPLHPRERSLARDVDADTRSRGASSAISHPRPRYSQQPKQGTARAHSRSNYGGTSTDLPLDSSGNDKGPRPYERRELKRERWMHARMAQEPSRAVMRARLIDVWRLQFDCL